MLTRGRKTCARSVIGEGVANCVGVGDAVRVGAGVLARADGEGAVADAVARVEGVADVSDDGPEQPARKTAMSTAVTERTTGR